VLGVEQRSGAGVIVHTDGGEHVADVAVVAAGPWAAELIRPVGVAVDLRPQVSQVSYVRGPGDGWAQRPALVHDFDSVAVGFYALPTPGIGYKIGQDGPVRPWDPEATDRTPDPTQVEATSELVRREFPGFDPTIVSSDVCTWTDSADALFVLGRVGDVVIGCGDSGAGFKWLPLFGEWLGGLALGQELSGDAACFDLARFAS
jgi:sarcosine oxidase